jgi:large subunit ribosomal protein L4
MHQRRRIRVANAMTLDVINGQNEKISSVELSDEVFGGRVNRALIWQSVVHQNAEDRRGTHSTKTRGEVRGSGKKPWRQKGTGRARVGEIRNPLWRKGGIVFGPKPRSYGYHLAKKVVRGALRSALSQKLRDSELTVIEEITVDEPKTRKMVEKLSRLGITGSVVLVDVKLGDDVERSARNLPGVHTIETAYLTARDVVGGGQLIVSKAAIKRLEEVLTP